MHNRRNALGSQDFACVESLANAARRLDLGAISATAILEALKFWILAWVPAFAGMTEILGMIRIARNVMAAKAAIHASFKVFDD